MRHASNMRRWWTGVGTLLGCCGYLVALPIAQAPDLAPLSPLSSRDAAVTYYIARGSERSGHRPGDTELAAWALQEWERKSAGGLRLKAADIEPNAVIRLYWLSPTPGGELAYTSAPVRKPRRRASIFITPDMSKMKPDIAQLARQHPLARDVIMYLPVPPRDRSCPWARRQRYGVRRHGGRSSPKHPREFHAVSFVGRNARGHPEASLVVVT